MFVEVFSQSPEDGFKVTGIVKVRNANNAFNLIESMNKVARKTDCIKNNRYDYRVCDDILKAEDFLEKWKRDVEIENSKYSVV